MTSGIRIRMRMRIDEILGKHFAPEEAKKAINLWHFGTPEAPDPNEEKGFDLDAIQDMVRS